MAAIQTPMGAVPVAQVMQLFEQTGFEPPPGVPLEEAFMVFLEEMRQSGMLREPPAPRAPKGRTAVPCSIERVPEVLGAHGASVVLLEPLGAEVRGVDTTKALHPELAGALEAQMAHAGFLLFRSQGDQQSEKGIRGKYLTGEQQVALTEAFGPGALHSTHGVHPESPNRDVFRLSNDQNHGFNQVGPEWHNDGSFCREVFGHVVYHIIKAPAGPGDTRFAHLGVAYDLLPPADQARYSQCASVNSNGGVVHPLVHDHPISGRRSLYLHTGMTGAIIERCEGPADPTSLQGIKAWEEPDMDRLFQQFTALLDRADVSYSHQWQEGDVIIIDNLAVAHKAAPGAHLASSGLRILHRTTAKGSRPLDPDPALGLPLELDTSAPCPAALWGRRHPVWVEGYVGFRWGDHQSRTVPH